MGTETKKYYTDGEICPNCVDVLWAGPYRPYYFKATFSGVKLCPSVPPTQPDPNREFLLRGSPIYPCRWEREAYNWMIIMDIWPSYISCDVYDELFLRWFFYSESVLPCEQKLDNQANCDSFAGELGSVSLNPHPGPQFLISNDYNFSSWWGTKYERWDTSDEKIIFRIANRLRSTNYLVKYDPKI